MHAGGLAGTNCTKEPQALCSHELAVHFTSLGPDFLIRNQKVLGWVSTFQEVFQGALGGRERGTEATVKSDNNWTR